MSEFPMNTNSDSNFCVLVSETNPEIKYILLDKEPLILGRTQRTGIVDLRMSKSQMKFEADYSMNRVLVEQLGSNKSAVKGESMIKGEKRLLYDGDTISLLFNSNHIYRLDFVSPPNYGVESNKRPTTSSDQDISYKKHRSDSTSNWETRDGTLLVYNSSNIVHKNKIAAFDMDGTIIVTQSGKTFPIDSKDWKINFPEVLKAIRKLSDDGYKIIIFTNQGGIGKNKVDEKSFKEKVENIIGVIKTPIQVFVATHGDIYRKPAPGMWNTLVSDYNGGLLIDKSTSFFCGDAAGRSARINNNGQKIKKDHSCCDRLFAMNIDLKFYTPEEYFLEASTEKFILPTFNPNDVVTNAIENPELELFAKKEMIIMVGSPGSGKSFIANNLLASHGRMKIISRDTLGTWQKCVSEAKEYLNKYAIGVVIDNTNPDVESRQRFIDIAKSMNIPCRVFLMNVSKEHARHNNKFRELTNNTHQKVTDTIINLYFSKFEEPSRSEGIDEIIKLNFVPHFQNSEERNLYKMYLL